MKRLLAPIALLVLLALPSGAAADLGGIHVVGPPGVWHESRVFTIEWSEPTTGPVGYRFLNAPWDTATHWQDVRTAISIPISIPPGATEPPAAEYLIEIWAWNHGLDQPPGPASFLGLPYDNSTPSPPRLGVSSGWFDSHTPIPVTIGPPVWATPSGIRGYAIAISANAGESPCAVPARCADSELLLPEAGGGRQLKIGPLPEGINFVNVLAVSNTGRRSAVATLPARVDASPPAIRFAGVPPGWVNHPVTVAAIAEDRSSGTEPAGPGGPAITLAVDGGTPSLALGGTIAATVKGDGLHSVTAWARDLLGNSDVGGATPLATVRIDETPPEVAFANAQRTDDPELIRVAVDDSLSGPSPDRGTIGVRAAGSGGRFEPLPTKATDGGLEARWNSDDFPPGSYEFRATGYDAVGNPTQSERRASGSPMVLRNPIKLPTAVDSGFGGAKLVWQRCRRIDGDRRSCHREAVSDYESRPALRTVPYGRALRFGGVLRSATGGPLAGLPVEVVETFAAGTDAAQRRTTVKSRGDGRFEALLAPGPSRRVEAFFPGTKTLTRSSGREVTMAVRAGVRFEASTESARIGGKPVIFSGRLLAGEATIHRTGRPIRLEFRVPGGEWSEFRTVQTDRHGRFRYPYAFTDDDSQGIRFQFRAVSPEQSDFPYRPSASAPVAVTGY